MANSKKNCKILAFVESTILSLQNLSIRRGETAILKNVSWEIRTGENWVILGANGSGKTALLRALTGYFPPSAGRMVFDGQTYGKAPWQEVRKRIGLVSSALTGRMEDDALPLEIVAAGREAILNPWKLSPERDRREARRWLKRLGAQKLADRPWLFLSQGERQRVLIARALMTDPALLILDEPCSGLDPVARELFLRRIDGLAGAAPIVLVTHHVEEITPIYSHILLLRLGRVVAAGPIREKLHEANLEKTFGAPVCLRRRQGRLTLTLR